MSIPKVLEIIFDTFIINSMLAISMMTTTHQTQLASKQIRPARINESIKYHNGNSPLDLLNWISY
jgi:hypothetical protein